jgi:hypothetical protein
MNKFSIDRITERDVDVSITEELNISLPFANWVVGHTARFKDKKLTNAEAFVSLFDSSGETDVTVILTDQDENNFGLLIENKIDAMFQPNQIERYFHRGNRGILDKKWSGFAVVVLAPRAYLERHVECAKADAQIAYEDVAAFFKERDPTLRGQYRAAFFENAAPRGSSAYIRQQDDETNEFWNAAYLLATDNFPILEMRQPDYASGTTWVTFRPSDLPSRVHVDLKADRGIVDLTFSNVNRDRFANVASGWLLANSNIQQASKSSVIRQHCTPFVVSPEFQEVKSAVEDGFKKCKLAVEYFRLHRAELTALLDA